jgi:hypothetical protein
MSTLFGAPKGSPWREWITKPPSDFSFTIANPIYITHTTERLYVFTHGAHFAQKVLTWPGWVKSLISCFLCGFITKYSRKLKEAKSLEDLERITATFMDSLWPSSKNLPTSQSDQFWYLCCKLSGRMDNKRSSPTETRLLQWGNLDDRGIKRLIHGDKKDESIARWEEYFWSHLLPHLKAHKDRHAPERNNLTFVYGDTHDGGWGEISNSPWNTRIYNCGGWVVDKADHPPCHVFAVVGEDGRETEYLLDVSFEDVSVNEESILSLAAMDTENRGRLLHFILTSPFLLISRIVMLFLRRNRTAQNR